MDNFRELLNKHHEWPCEYVFKFIVPIGKESDVTALFPSAKISIKPSAKGNYVSITVIQTVTSADAVIEAQHRAAKIEGLISL